MWSIRCGVVGRPIQFTRNPNHTSVVIEEQCFINSDHVMSTHDHQQSGSSGHHRRQSIPQSSPSTMGVDQSINVQDNSSDQGPVRNQQLNNPPVRSTTSVHHRSSTKYHSHRPQSQPANHVNVKCRSLWIDAPINRWMKPTTKVSESMATNEKSKASQSNDQPSVITVIHRSAVAYISVSHQPPVTSPTNQCE